MKKGNLLLIIIILLFIIMVSISLWLVKLNRQQPIKKPEDISNIDNQIKEVTDRNEFYMVQNCANKFYKYYGTMFDTKEDDDISKLNSLLDKEYIEYKGITEENILTVLTRKGEVVVNITDMLVSKQTETVSVYIVEGILRDELTKELSNFKIMIKVDFQNKTFSVLPQDYTENIYPKLELGDSIRLKDASNIEKGRYNAYVEEDVSDKVYLIDLIERYKEEALYNPELAYEHLNEEYKNTKFGTLENFKEYVSNNVETISNIELEKYLILEQDGYIQYVCVDTKGWYYIFQETSLREYSLLLDTHTIDLPEFLQKYNAASSVNRVGYNIQRILDAINCKDYNYVYNKLDLEFKAVNYVTIENFEKAIKNKLFDRNEIKEIESFNEGSVYAFKLTITDALNNEKEQSMTVIMKLKEGTDFVMSFSFDE